MWPNSATASALIRRRAPPSRTSAWCATILRSQSSTSRTVSCRSSGVAMGYATESICAQMSRAMMSAPSSASRTAWERPCPRAAPVMIATFPWSRPPEPEPVNLAIVRPPVLLSKITILPAECHRVEVRRSCQTSGRSVGRAPCAPSGIGDVVGVGKLNSEGKNERSWLTAPPTGDGRLPRHLARADGDRTRRRVGAGLRHRPGLHADARRHRRLP